MLSTGVADSYDFENHLVQKGAVTIAYDGDGNRVSETVGGVTTNYLVDTQNPTGYAHVVDELVSGVVTRTYAYGMERISESQTLNSAWTPSFYGYDGHGSVRQLTNSAGVVTDTYDYDAFGNLINSTGNTPNVYLFAGEQFDPALGLYYNRARYYNNATGRFWTADSYEGNSRDPLSLHKYLYSEGNPVDHVDPSGNEIDEVLTVAALVVTIAAITVLSACNATPPSATILKNEVVKDPWLGLYKDWAVQFKFPTDASQYVVVQWIEGSYTINGKWVETNSQGKPHNTDFEDWTIDSNSSLADYGTTKQSSNSLLLYDSPGNLSLAPGQAVGALSHIRFNADYHFLDQVYKRSNVGTKCSDFNAPWDPVPILSVPWDFVDSYQIP